MAVSKVIELLGTRSLSDANSILAYNSKTFLDPDLYTALGLTSDLAEILRQVPTKSTVDNIFSILNLLPEYQLIQGTHLPSGEVEFIYQNDKFTVIDGQGFDTIIFLSSGELLGYLVLLSPVGSYVITENSGKHSVRKNYRVGTVKIYVSSDSNNIRVGEDSISLLGDLGAIDKIDRKLIGPENHEYADKKCITSIKPVQGNYNIRLGSLLRSRRQASIFTDTFSCLFKDGGVTTCKLKIKKNIILPSTYSSFTNHQVGYYHGDLVLYIWKNNGQYSIFSLTKTLSDIFGDPRLEYSPVPYTSARQDSTGQVISNTEVYTLPILYPGGSNESQKIRYFAGEYIIVDVLDPTTEIWKTAVFSIDLQDAKEDNNSGWIIESYVPTGLIKTYRYDNGVWTSIPDSSENVETYCSFDTIPEDLKVQGKVVKVIERVPKYLDSFVLDRNDLKGYLHKMNKNSWQTYKEAIQDYQGFSNIFVNTRLLLMRDAVLQEKCGDWHILYNSQDKTYIYTNMNKSLKVSIGEPKPIIINDQVLVTYTQNNDTTTYLIYNEPGHYISEPAARRLYKWSPSKVGMKMTSDEIWGQNYYIYRPKEDSDKFLTINTSTDGAMSPVVLQDSFLSLYRRNVLPQTLDDFRIIGAIGGIVFYRIGNTINYL